MEKKIQKRPRGRPPGRSYPFLARIPMKAETWEALNEIALKTGTTATAIVRECAERYVKRHGQ